MINMITLEELKTILNYDSDTGDFYWKINRARLAKQGDKAGHTNKDGYTIIKIKCKAYKAHRLAWLYIKGEFPSKDIDHINGIKHDNRINNLRDVSERQNCYNRKSRKDSVSKIKNVSWHSRNKTWDVNISFEGKNKYIGSFKDLELAELIAIESRIKFHGIYAKI